MRAYIPLAVSFACVVMLVVAFITSASSIPRLAPLQVG